MCRRARGSLGDEHRVIATRSGWFREYGNLTRVHVVADPQGSRLEATSQPQHARRTRPQTTCTVVPTPTLKLVIGRSVALAG